MQHLRPTDLAERWQVTTKTLANARCKGEGPSYIKVGGSVRYPLAAVEDYEAARVVDAA